MRPVKLLLFGISQVAAFYVYAPRLHARSFSCLQATATAVPRTSAASVKSAHVLPPKALVVQGTMSSEEVASLLQEVLFRLAIVEQDLKILKKKAEV
jgi:hypothetical protein